MIRRGRQTFWRLLWMLGVVFGALGDFLWRHGFRAAGRTPCARAEWLSRWSRRALAALGIEVEVRGTVPDRGLLIANHVSYVDVLVLSALGRCIFVAKQEVRRWPLMGWCARCAGTLFIDRQRRSEVKRLGEAFTPVIEQGVLLVLFPEGTSTHGRHVLPFHSSLLAPAVEGQWPVLPVWLGYTMPPAEGTVEECVCFWRDMTLVPHLFKLLTRKGVRAQVACGSPVAVNQDRKVLARVLRQKVCQLAGQYDRTLPSAEEKRTAPAA